MKENRPRTNTPFHHIVPSPSTALASPNNHLKGLSCINQSVLVWSCSFSDSICIGHRKQCPHYGQICIRMSSSRTGPYCGTRYWCGAGKVIIHKSRGEVSLVDWKCFCSLPFKILHYFFKKIFKIFTSS